MSEIHFNHTWVVLYLFYGSFREQTSLVQHRHTLRNRADKIHVMLDYDQ
jgi:hypothetical protein